MMIINTPSKKSSFFRCAEKASEILLEAGASAVSYIPIGQCRVLRPYLLPEHAAGALIFTVPYLCSEALPDSGGNLSLYAVPRDYHIFFRELFLRIEKQLSEEFPQTWVRGFSDHSPIDEVHAAAIAGLGVIGDNRLLITEKYGSYVFIGELYFSDIHTVPEKNGAESSESSDKLRLPPSDKHIHEADSAQACRDDITSEISKPENIPSAPPTCIHCGACTESCPSPSLCLSSLTQKKGELNDREYGIIQKSSCVWGCDICQTVCPMNQNAGETPVRFFRESLRRNLTLAELEKMPESEFSERAYAWRGRKTIARNLMIKESQKDK